MTRTLEEWGALIKEDLKRGDEAGWAAIRPSTKLHIGELLLEAQVQMSAKRFPRWAATRFRHQFPFLDHNQCVRECITLAENFYQQLGMKPPFWKGT